MFDFLLRMWTTKKVSREQLQRYANVGFITQAEYEVKKQAVELAVELSMKALDNQIDEETHRKLIGDFIAKVGM